MRELPKRCPLCHTCPQPKDIEYFWGVGCTHLAACKACRTDVDEATMGGARGQVQVFNTKPALVCVVDKLNGMPAELLQLPLLLGPLRDAIRLREYRHTCFISDAGDRLWKWEGFPFNRHQSITWDVFMEKYPIFDLYQPSDTQQSLVKIESDNDEDEPPFHHLVY